MRRIAFVGLSGPTGYDYRNPIDDLLDEQYDERQRRDGTLASIDYPNPVLENVCGLALSYDEIYFLTRSLCPRDMQNLPYVRFVSEDTDMARLATDSLVSLEENRKTYLSGWKSIFRLDAFTAVTKTMIGGRNRQFAIDNHSRAINVTNSLTVSGNSGDVANAIRDLWVASAIPDAVVDVIFCSQILANIRHELEPEYAELYRDNANRLKVAQGLVELNVLNHLSINGSYNPRLEEFRARRDVQDFRAFLDAVSAGDMEDDVTTLVKQISVEAYKLADESARRYYAPSTLYKSVSTTAISVFGNLVAAPAGTVAGGAAKLAFDAEEWGFKKNTRWAPFVVNLQRPDF